MHYFNFMWAFAAVLTHVLILKSIVSHCRSSIQCHTPSVEEQAQEEQGEIFLSKLSQTPQLFSSLLSQSAQFPSHLLPLGLQKATTPRGARALPFSRRTPDTSSPPIPATGAASTPSLGWKVSRLPLCSWSILVLQQLLRDLVLGSHCISKDSLTQVCTATKT